MSEAIAKIKPMDEFLARFDARRETYAQALPSHVPVDRLRATLISAIAKKPKLLQCEAGSLHLACLQAASDGLLPNGRDAAIVDFRDRKTGKMIAQYMPMIGGLLRLMRNSKLVRSFDVQAVHVNDEFDFELGTAKRLRFVKNLDGDRGPLRCVYAAAELTDGTTAFEVMTLEDVNKRRAVSRSADSGPWKTWYPEMAMKTVARRLMKYLPSSADIDRLIDHMDQDTDFDRENQSRRGSVIVDVDDGIIDVDPHDEDVGGTGD